MATSLDKLENEVQMHHLSYGENIAKICPVCPEIFNEIRLFLAVSYLTFSNELHYLLSYPAEVHQICT